MARWTHADRKRLLLRALAVGVAVVGLAGVILAGAALSPSKRPAQSEPPPTSATGESTSRQADQLVAAARQALASGDASAATALLKQATALEPAHREAQRLLREVTRLPNRASPTPTPTASTPSGGSGGSASGTTPVSLLPGAIEGFGRGVVVAQGSTAMVAYATESGSVYTSRVSVASAAVHDLGSSYAANSFITRVSKSAYSRDAGSVAVGHRQGYFGTDGTHSATLAYTQGRYVFEVIVSAVEGVAPSSLKDVATAIAEGFPDAD